MALQASRFALLSIDDDTDSDDKSCKSKSLSKKDVQQSTSAKKRNKKKKKNIEKLENDEVPFLLQMAYYRPHRLSTYF